MGIFFYLDIILQTGFKQRKARAPFGEPPPPEFPPFRRPLQLRVYPPVGLPTAREGSPRLRAFPPRDQEWPLVAAMVHLSVAAVALGCTPFFYTVALC